MPAFVFAQVQSVTNPARLAEYQGLAEPTVIQYGGKFLAGGTKIEVADGDWSPIGVMAAEFESLAKAKEWYYSPDYQAVVGRRLESTVGGLIFVDAG
ncbi:MAG: hypothetical protein BZY80_04640 [SAR202 cluster bacterium Io17-Chloro-G2]|nr:MAG: hypothetical protein BZY80_04640 [SAR202 cluster bacterium Io17-Chloro-G2]